MKTLDNELNNRKVPTTKAAPAIWKDIFSRDGSIPFLLNSTAEIPMQIRESTNRQIGKTRFSTFMLSFFLLAVNKSINLTLVTDHTLKSITIKKMIAKQSTVCRNAPAENTIWNLSNSIAKSFNATKESPCEKSNPRTKPETKAMTPTQRVSPANSREMRLFFMPSTIYTPNSFLRRFKRNWLA